MHNHIHVHILVHIPTDLHNVIHIHVIIHIHIHTSSKISQLDIIGKERHCIANGSIGTFLLIDCFIMTSAICVTNKLIPDAQPKHHMRQIFCCFYSRLFACTFVSVYWHFSRVPICLFKQCPCSLIVVPVVSATLFKILVYCHFSFHSLTNWCNG